MFRKALVAPTLILTLTMGLALVASSVHAKVERTTDHSYDHVWPAAIRHIRIDEGHKIVDKDADVGYVVFEVKDDGKAYRGALELIRVEAKGERPKVKLVLRIEDRPTYMESGLLERLLQKLHDENGDPPEQAPDTEAKE